MARKVKRGDIWMYAFAKPDKRRPVLIISRPSVIPLLRTVMVAPITSAIHGVPSEVRVGIENRHHNRRDDWVQHGHAPLDIDVDDRRREHGVF